MSTLTYREQETLDALQRMCRAHPKGWFSARGVAKRIQGVEEHRVFVDLLTLEGYGKVTSRWFPNVKGGGDGFRIAS